MKPIIDVVEHLLLAILITVLLNLYKIEMGELQLSYILVYLEL